MCLMRWPTPCGGMGAISVCASAAGATDAEPRASKPFSDSRRVVMVGFSSTPIVSAKKGSEQFSCNTYARCNSVAQGKTRDPRRDGGDVRYQQQRDAERHVVRQHFSQHILHRHF